MNVGDDHLNDTTIARPLDFNSLQLVLDLDNDPLWG